MLKMKKVKERVSKYRRMSKKLGGGFVKKGNTTLEEYGLIYVESSNDNRKISIIDEMSETVLNSFKDYHNYTTTWWISKDKSYIVISIGNRVFKKGKDSAIEELNEVKGMHVVRELTNVALIFEKFDYWNGETKIMHLRTGKITSIKCRIFDISWLNEGIEMWQGNGYQYLYLKNKQLVCSDLFVESFQMSRQFNRKVGEEYRLYELNNEEGIVEKAGPWERVKELPDGIPFSHIVTAGERSWIIDIYAKKLEICPIPGKEIQVLCKLGCVTYYQIIGREKVYVCLFEGEKHLKILSEYIGNKIVLSEPNFNLKTGEIITNILNASK